VRTKCTEDLLASNSLDESDENDGNCSVDSEGGITPLSRYDYNKNTLIKNNTFYESDSMEISSVKSLMDGNKINFKTEDNT
jgi:hypothetical protein